MELLFYSIVLWVCLVCLDGVITLVVAFPMTSQGALMFGSSTVIFVVAIDFSSLIFILSLAIIDVFC